MESDSSAAVGFSCAVMKMSWNQSDVTNGTGYHTMYALEWLVFLLTTCEDSVEKISTSWEECDNKGNQ